MAENADYLRTVSAVARDNGVPIAWLRTEVREGRIPSLRVGRRRLLNAAAVRQLLLDRAAGHETRVGGRA